MINRISKKNFSSKLYSNVTNIQKLKTLKLPFNALQQKIEIKEENCQKNSNSENYLKAYKNLFEKQTQVNTNNKKFQETQRYINENFLKKTNQIAYENLLPSIDFTDNIDKNVFNKDKEQERKVLLQKEESILNKLNDLRKIKENLTKLKKNIQENREIMDISSKLNNEKYNKITIQEQKSTSKELTHSKYFNFNENSNEKFNNQKKQTIINNSHLYEFYYFITPFSNLLLSPHRYKEAFINSNKENISLKLDFENEQEILNSEIHSKLLETVDEEMKEFSLSDIKSNSTIFNDQVRNPQSVGYFLEESNRLIDYDYGIELERLSNVVNSEDDFGVTMYNEDGEKKNQKENNLRQEKKDMELMRPDKQFPFTMDKHAFVLVKNTINL